MDSMFCRCSSLSSLPHLFNGILIMLNIEIIYFTIYYDKGLSLCFLAILSIITIK